jgi:hypothetical protein
MHICTHTARKSDVGNNYITCSESWELDKQQRVKKTPPNDILVAPNDILVE